MGSKADFYIDNDGELEWVCSISEKGEPCNIPVTILTQLNEVMFKEYLDDYFSRKEDRRWPWLWEDSKMTDYSYIMDCKLGKVIGFCASEKIIFDPLKVVAGEDLNTSKIANAIPNFPKLGVING